MYRSASVIVQEQPWDIDGPAGILQALYQPAADPQAALAVIAHPHPLGGGSMQNKVVSTLMRGYRDLGMHVLRFNFRGVGASEGQHDHGRGEQEDLDRVVQVAQQRLQPSALYVAGFSFGSYVAAAWASRYATPVPLLLVAPPVDNYPMKTLQLPDPTWVIQGDQDELVAVDSVRHWVQHQPSIRFYRELPGCSHFFHGRLTELTEILHAAFTV